MILGPAVLAVVALAISVFALSPRSQEFMSGLGLNTFSPQPIVAVALAFAFLAAVALVPPMHRSLTFGIGLFVLSQPLTALAIDTPIASVTADNIVLLLLLVFHVLFGEKRKFDQGAGSVNVLLYIWIGTYVLRLTYVEPAGVARLLVTVISFFFIYLVARRLPQTYGTLKVLALTAFGALTTFGAAATLVSFGVIPRPAVGLTFARDIFGYVSPFPRTYGLNVAIDAIAFLGPLTMPVLAYWLVAPRIKGWTRFGALLAIGSLVVYVMLFFQARGMLSSIALSIFLALIVTRRHGRWLLFPVAIWAAIKYLPAVYTSLAGVDTVSSQLRFSNLAVLLGMVAGNPGDYLLGQNEGRVFYEIAVQLGLAEAIGGEGNDAIHNAFLSQLVGGGWLAFISFSLAFALMLRRAIKNLRKDPLNPVWQILTIAAMLVLFEMMLEPARAQVIGNWIILGLIFAKSPATPPTEAGPENDASRVISSSTLPKGQAPHPSWRRSGLSPARPPRTPSLQGSPTSPARR